MQLNLRNYEGEEQTETLNLLEKENNELRKELGLLKKYILYIIYYLYHSQIISSGSKEKPLKDRIELLETEITVIQNKVYIDIYIYIYTLVFNTNSRI